MKRRSYLAILGILFGTSSIISATETITYSYDARGRLIKVERAGTVNNGVQTVYTHDKANNRKSVTVTGSGGSSSSTTADFTITDPSVVEGNALTFTISRSGVTTSAVSIHYVRGNGTALTGSDWTGTTGVSTQISFAANEVSKTVTVATINDTVGEAPEFMLIDLHGPSAGATIAKARGTGTITDNDGPITLTNNQMVVQGNHGAVYGCLQNAYLNACWLHSGTVYVYVSVNTPALDPGYSLTPQGEVRVEQASYGTGVP